MPLIKVRTCQQLIKRTYVVIARNRLYQLLAVVVSMQSTKSQLAIKRIITNSVCENTDSNFELEWVRFTRQFHPWFAVLYHGGLRAWCSQLSSVLTCVDWIIIPHLPGLGHDDRGLNHL